MIKLPNFHKPFYYENNFYLSCGNSRIGKILTHYELLKLSSNIPGCIIECGVFKGISLIRLATFLKLLKSNKKKHEIEANGNIKKRFEIISTIPLTKKEIIMWNNHKLKYLTIIKD